MNLSFHYYVFQIPAIIIAMGLYEIVKGYTGTKLGDSTPKETGKLTLNPLKHIEIVGFLLMLFFGYGWSQPTKTNPAMYKNYKKGVWLTFLVPTAVNIAVGVLFALLVFATVTGVGTAMEANVVMLMHYIARYCVALAVVNVIPVYPFNGRHVLGLYLPPDARVKMSHYEKGFLAAVVIALVFGAGEWVLTPIVSAIVSLGGTLW